MIMHLSIQNWSARWGWGYCRVS